jgi:hypothetical protein
MFHQAVALKPTPYMGSQLKKLHSVHLNFPDLGLMNTSKSFLGAMPRALGFQ